MDTAQSGRCDRITCSSSGSGLSPFLSFNVASDEVASNKWHDAKHHYAYEKDYQQVNRLKESFHGCASDAQSKDHVESASSQGKRSISEMGMLRQLRVPSLRQASQHGP